MTKINPNKKTQSCRAKNYLSEKIMPKNFQFRNFEHNINGKNLCFNPIYILIKFRIAS